MEEVQYGEQDVLLSVPGDGGMRRMYKIRCLRKGAPYLSLIHISEPTRPY